MTGVLDETTEDVRILGAVNTIAIRDGRLTGHNTDHPGFRYALRSGLPEAALGAVLLVGTDGAGSAVAWALLTAGVGVRSAPRVHHLSPMCDLTHPSGR